MSGSREDFKRNNAFSLYDLYDHALTQEPLPHGSWNLQFCRPFLGHHFVWSMPGSREDLLRNTSILHLNYLLYGWGSWNSQCLVSLPYRCCIPNLVKIGPVVIEKKVLTHDGCQPIAIGHLSDSGDQKIINCKHLVLWESFESLNESCLWIMKCPYSQQQLNTRSCPGCN